MNSLAFVFIAGAVIATARSLPLRGTRRLGIVLLRVAGLLGVFLALRGCSVLHREERPRHIVYLADQSASIDREQTQWIARRLASLEAVRPPQMPRAVLAFGEHASLVIPADRAVLTDPQRIEQALRSSPVNREGTDIEQALLASLPALPPHERGRAILLSDGRQTRGNVERILPFLRRVGLEVYPVAVPPTGPSGVAWEQLTAPPVVQRGSSVPLKLVFTNGTDRPQPLDVTVSLQGLPVARRRERLPPGWHVVSLSVPALKAGTMAVEVAVTVPTDSQPQRRTAYVEVEGPPQLLLVLDRPTELPLLATALKRREMELAVTEPAELPVEVGKLLEYDAVVLFQIPKSSLTGPQVDALTQYVRRFAGGVVMVGLGGTLKDELKHEAPLDALLPAWFEPKGVQEAKRRVCVIMLIDRSASMMGPRIAATKRAAVELVKQLAPEDLVGVLAFDVLPYVVVEMQQARQVSATLIDKLVHLKSTGGTDFLPVLKAAKSRLEASGATVKHAILLSDGNAPFDSNAYRELLSGFSQQHISVSTVGIGSAFVNTDLLGWIAARAGGTFYQMTNLDELPQLVARDTQKTLGELPFAEGYFRPVRTSAAEWFDDVTEWPPLKGYLTTTAKPGSRTELEIHQAEATDPLLSHWSVGLGRVALFASDADTRWSSEWIRWPQFESVWAHMMRSTMRPRPTEELFVWVDEQAGNPQVVIEGELRDPTAELVSADGSAIMPLALVQHSRFRWRAPVSHVDSGWYRLVVESHPQRGAEVASGGAGSPQPATLLAKRWIQIGRVDSRLEQPHLAPDEVLLSHIAQATHGAFDVTDRAFLPPTDWVERRVPLRGWLLPIVLLLLLADIALRGRTML